MEKKIQIKVTSEQIIALDKLIYNNNLNDLDKAMARNAVLPLLLEIKKQKDVVETKPDINGVNQVYYWPK